MRGCRRGFAGTPQEPAGASAGNAGLPRWAPGDAERGSRGAKGSAGGGEQGAGIKTRIKLPVCFALAPEVSVSCRSPLNLSVAANS